jgi:hypothetical protein
VFTFTLAPRLQELAVDAQPGAVSVTNPPTDRVVIPESSRLSLTNGVISIQRQSLSSLMKPGQPVITDADLRELFRVAEALTAAHLAEDNAGVPAARQRRSLVMDFEFRRVLAGWPALQQGQNPPRFVIKQARPLEPSPHVSPALRAAPIPHDVLSRARRIETKRCTGPSLEISALSVFTDPDALPDLGYSQRPLLAGLGVTFANVPPRVFTHLEQRSAQVSAAGLAVELLPGFAFARVEVAGGVAVLTQSNGVQQRRSVECTDFLDYAEPRELLRSFLGTGM